MFSSDEHLLNDKYPMVVTESGMTIFLINEHPLKAESDISVMLSEREMVVIIGNVDMSISCNELSVVLMIMCSSFSHPANDVSLVFVL